VPLGVCRPIVPLGVCRPEHEGIESGILTGILVKIFHETEAMLAGLLGDWVICITFEHEAVDKSGVGLPPPTKSVVATPSAASVKQSIRV
jgi:hypothetical protein